ncbi:MAG TPA: hypothetical protein VK745_06700, partial [Polyangiaceae bacterium]|nr:hypothetical protein [Polyangiaceae bacterium]
KSAKRLWQAALRATGHPLAEKLSHQLGRADHSYFVFNLKFKLSLNLNISFAERCSGRRSEAAR